MSSRLIRRRWIACWAIAALALQALVLALQTPMAVARGLGASVVQVDHCAADGHPAGHHDGTAPSGDMCSLCLGVQIAGQAVVPAAPALPVPVAAPAPATPSIATGTPGHARHTPQNPRAPPLPA